MGDISRDTSSYSRGLNLQIRQNHPINFVFHDHVHYLYGKLESENQTQHSKITYSPLSLQSTENVKETRTNCFERACIISPFICLVVLIPRSPLFRNMLALSYRSFEALKAASRKTTIFCCVMPCSPLEIHRRSSKTLCSSFAL